MNVTNVIVNKLVRGLDPTLVGLLLEMERDLNNPESK